jgi:hypothetical protein
MTGMIWFWRRWGRALMAGGEFVVVVGGGGLGKGEGEAAEEQGACDEGLHIQIDV